MLAFRLNALERREDIQRLKIGDCSFRNRGQLLALSIGEGINPLADFSARLVSLAAGFRKPNLRIAATRDAVVFTQMIIFEAPKLRAAGPHFNIKPAFVRAFVGPRSGFHGSDLDIF